MAGFTLLALPAGNNTIRLCFMNDSPWNSQGVDRLIYHQSVYAHDILMCLSKVCDFWYQVSHCLQHFVEIPVTLQTYIFQKMPEVSWQPLFETLKYQFFAFAQCEKGSMDLQLKHLPPMQGKTTTISLT